MLTRDKNWNNKLYYKQNAQKPHMMDLYKFETISCSINKIIKMFKVLKELLIIRKHQHININI